MREALHRRGARTILCPSVEIAPPERPGPFRRALAELDRFDWVVLTSASAVEAVARVRDAPDRPLPGVAPRRLAVVGSATAAAAEELGWSVDLVPEEFTAEALLRALEREVDSLAGTTMLLPLAEAAGDLLPDGLRERGVRVTRVSAYRTVPATPGELEALTRELEAGTVDLLTFTSPSTAAGFLEAVGPAGSGVPAAVIGPVTAEAAAELGFRVVAVAEEHTVTGLVAAVERVLGRAVGAS